MRGNPGTAVLWAGGESWDEQGYEQQGAVVGDTCAPCFSTEHPPTMQPASNLFRKALLHKEKCSASAGALGQSTALTAAWAQRLTPAHRALVAFGFSLWGVCGSALLVCGPVMGKGSTHR